MAMMNHFPFFYSYYKTTQALSDADLGAVIRAVCRYGIEGMIPEDLPIWQKVVFDFIRLDLDAAADHYQDRVEKARASAQARYSNERTHANAENAESNSRTHANAGKEKEKEIEIEKEIKKESLPNGKDKKESAARFSPPTEEQVNQYAQEKGYQIDASRFVDFYASKGWMVGSNHMRDWKAAVRNWVSRPDRAPTRQAPFGKQALDPSGCVNPGATPSFDTDYDPWHVPEFKKPGGSS